MKPQGRRTVNFPNNIDCHPEKGYVNWWENMSVPSNKRERSSVKLELNKLRICDMYDD